MGLCESVLVGGAMTVKGVGPQPYGVGGGLPYRTVGEGVLGWACEKSPSGMWV